MSGCRRTIFNRRQVVLFASILPALVPAWLPKTLHAQQDAALLQPPPGIEVKIQAQPLKATVGDPIQIDLDFTLPRGYRFSFPNLPGQIGQFAVLEAFPGPDIPSQQPAGKTPAPAALPATKQEPEVHHHRARIVVAVYSTGDFEFPALPFTLSDNEGKKVQVSSPAIKIRIDSVLPPGDLNLKDLKKQAEITEPFPWPLWMSLGALALALVLLVLWMMKRRRRPVTASSLPPDMDPLDLAEADLRDLLGRGLLEKGFIKQFYILLSDIIKRALEAGYGIQTIEMTTSEIVAVLEGDSRTGADNTESASLENIEHLLLSCDLVKFARYVPSRIENEGAVKQAHQILADCRARRQMIPSDAAPVAGVS